MKFSFPYFNKEVAPKPEPISYRAEFRDFLQKNAPTDFEHKFAPARPFIVASFIAWPLFWLYKGLDWSQKRQMERLATYINKSFLQAKLIQVGIISAGLMAAILKTNEPQFVQRVLFIPKKKQEGTAQEAIDGTFGGY